MWKLLFVALFAFHCTNQRPVSSILFVQIDSSTKLEVVDWGGSGPPVVFLAGLGHTAHVFDNFAIALAQKYHVLGITRRGFGLSSQPDSGYNIPTLAEDIRIVIDSLRLNRPVLIGHSLGGDEMTLLARNHPGNVRALVYIEGAYNRVSARDSLARYEAPESERLPPSNADLASAEAYQSYYEKVNGVRMPLSEIKAMNRWTADGQHDGSVTPSWIHGRIVETLHDPDYSNIGTPALAIYATQYPVTELFLDYQSRDSTTQQTMREYLEASLRIDSFSREFFRSHMAKGRIVKISGAGHSLYITHARETLDAIEAFLAEVL